MQHSKFWITLIFLLGCGATEIGNLVPPNWQKGELIGTVRTTSAAPIGGSDFIDQSLGGVGVDDSGNALVAFRKFNADLVHYSVVSTRFNKQSGWENPVYVDSESGESLYGTTDGGPILAMNPDGRAIAIWQSGIANSCPPCNGQILGSDYLESRGWSTPSSLFQATLGSPAVGGITFGSNDTAFGIWSEFNQGWNYLSISPFQSGTGWGTSQSLSGNPSFPKIAIDSNSSGEAIAIWVEKNADNMFQVFSRRFVSGVGWDPQSVPISDILESYADLQIKMDAAGDAIAVWSPITETGMLHSVFVNRYIKGFGWEVPIPLKPEEGFPISPSLCMNTRGEAFVVWTNNYKNIDQLRLFSFSKTTNWTEVTPPYVATPNVDVFQVSGAKCTLDHNGTLTIADVVYVRDPQVGNFIGTVWIQQSPEGKGKWFKPLQLGIGLNIKDQNIQMALNSFGKLFVAWEHVGTVNNNYMTVWEHTKIQNSTDLKFPGTSYRLHRFYEPHLHRKSQV